MIIQKLYFKITNRSNAYPLSIKEDANLEEWNDKHTQHWLFEEIEEECYRIVQQSTNRVLEANSKGEVFLSEWKDNEQQKWSVDNVGEGYCCLVHKTTGRVLDGIFRNKMYTLYWNGSDFQQWKLERVESNVETTIPNK